MLLARLVSYIHRTNGNRKITPSKSEVLLIYSTNICSAYNRFRGSVVCFLVVAEAFTEMHT